MSGLQPQRFGRYLLMRTIGSADVAETYRARLAALQGDDRVLAIKRVRPFYANDAQFVAAWLSEARAAATLTHEHIVRVFEAEAVGDNVFQVLEYVPGESLRAVQERAAKRGEPLAPSAVAELVEHVANALHYAHQQSHQGRRGILHRDVSPYSILVGYDGSVKVTDFGVSLAKTHITQTQAGLERGKAEYMAPEQVSGKGADARSDQFSLGAVLWELLTGERLFSAESDFVAINKIMSMEIPSPTSKRSSVPESFSRVAMRALSRDPAQRFASAGELARELEKARSELANTTTLAVQMKALFAAELDALGAELAQERQIADDIISGRHKLSAPAAPQAAEPEPASEPAGPNPGANPGLFRVVEAEPDSGGPSHSVDDADESTRPWRPKRALGIDGPVGGDDGADATKVMQAIDSDYEPPRDPNPISRVTDLSDIPIEREGNRTRDLIIAVALLLALGGAGYWAYLTWG